MDTDTIRLLTQAARSGATFTTTDDRVTVTGNPDTYLAMQLRNHRDQIRELLLADHCAACPEPHWIREADTHIPWCRTHANARGLQLLRHETPHLLEH